MEKEVRPQMQIYAKLYSTMVGRVDTAISYLEDMIDQRAFDWNRTIQVTEMLKAALAEAEELYVSTEEEKAPKLIVLGERK